jgi:hypothetical protein
MWILFLSLLLLWSSPTLWSPQAAKPDHSGAPVKAGEAIDPYAPLRRHDGKWDLLAASGDKSAAQVHLANRCAQAGEFFVCNQLLNGKNMALTVFLPFHPLEHGGYAYRNQVLWVDWENSGAWGDLEIVGNRWVYSNVETVKENKVFCRTINILTGAD